jgi:hypothetical protein
MTSVHKTIFNFFYFNFPTSKTKCIRLQKAVKNSPAIAVLAPRTFLNVNILGTPNVQCCSMQINIILSLLFKIYAGVLSVFEHRKSVLVIKNEINEY